MRGEAGWSPVLAVAGGTRKSLGLSHRLLACLLYGRVAKLPEAKDDDGTNNLKMINACPANSGLWEGSNAFIRSLHGYLRATSKPGATGEEYLVNPAHDTPALGGLTF